MSYYETYVNKQNQFVCPVYENDQQFPNFYGVISNTIYNTPRSLSPPPLPLYQAAYKQPDSYYGYSVFPPYHSAPYNAEPTFTPKLLECGPVYDPYCPSGNGVIGGADMYGYPTCICPTSGRLHTWPTIDPHSPAEMATTYPSGPFATCYQENE